MVHMCGRIVFLIRYTEAAFQTEPLSYTNVMSRIAFGHPTFSLVITLPTWLIDPEKEEAQESSMLNQSLKLERAAKQGKQRFF